MWSATRLFELNRNTRRMALKLEDIAGHPALHRYVQEQSLALIRIYEESPRLASIFATQQRW
ncbi:hypothetical protein EN981_25500, partial [Mesorhizobium sp. M7A.F.Ca.CA.001.13.2.1]